MQQGSFSLNERWILLLLLVLLGFPWLQDISKGELHLLTDETRHAMNGVFILDLLRDTPVSWPLQYAYEYYGKYPAVSLGYWPPAFYFVEALFFGLFGIAVWVSRLAILPFAVAGAFFWYKIARCYARPAPAFTSVIVYACLPAVLLYEKSTMLEIPTLALCLGAIYFWLLLLRTERPAYLYAAALFAGWAFLTKQTAIFLVPFFGLHFLFERKWFLLKWKHTYLALLGVIVLVGPWLALVMKLHPLAATRATPSFGQPWSPPLGEVLTHYPLTLPGELGFLLLGLSVLGIGAAIIAREYPALRLFLAWVIASYLTFTPLIERAPRYIMAWLLPFIFFAVYFVWRTLSRWPRVALGALAGLALYFYLPALAYQRPYVVGCEEAARYLAAQPNSDLLFYQGTLNGNFIFFVRKFDPEKRRLVVREKAIIDSRGRQRLRTPAEVEQMLSSLGVHYVVVESKDFLPELAVTRKALQSSQFEFVKEFPVRTNDYRVEGIKLLIYRSKAPPPTAPVELEIPMVKLRHDLRLPLSRLVGHPWPPQDSPSH